jgi:hypothetical protein
MTTRSVFEVYQLQPAEPLGAGEDVDPDDFPTRDVNRAKQCNRLRCEAGASRAG